MNRIRPISRNDNAFTLIELLVVIAIITILAAILFPVFAQARVKARASACASNLHQLGLAYCQYTQDYDEYTPPQKLGSMTGYDGATVKNPAWCWILQPYIKSTNVLLCPDRNQYFNPAPNPAKPGKGLGPDPYGCYDDLNNSGQCLGYGYNDGFVSDTATGLLSSGSTRLGRNISQIVAEAQTFAFGDSWDTGSMSMATDNIGSTFTQNSTAAIRHQSRLNMCFVDGHVKSVAFVVLSLTNDSGWTESASQPLLVPASKSDALDYCFDPNFEPSANGPWNGGKASKYPLDASVDNNVTATCADYVNDIYSNPTQKVLP